VCARAAITLALTATTTIQRLGCHDIATTS
jgi:hypothetical protein